MYAIGSYYEYAKIIDEDKNDEETNLSKEKKEVSCVAFKPVSVFDISQTSGKALPKLIENA